MVVSPHLDALITKKITDYPTKREISPFGTGYFVELPGGGVARCNPISAPFACTVRNG